MALTVIAMLGCVFSPWYARARRRAWSTTAALGTQCGALSRLGKTLGHDERDAAAVTRNPDQLTIGTSRVLWDGNALQIEVDEKTSPWPQRLRGHIRVTPRVRHATPYPLDAAGRHLWWRWHRLLESKCNSMRQFSRGKVQPYLDANQGLAPLEEDFDSWHWSRSHGAGQTRVSVRHDRHARPCRPIVVTGVWGRWQCARRIAATDTASRH